MVERRARPAPGRFRNRLTAAFVLVAAVSSGALAVVTVTLANGYRWRSFRAAAQSEAALALALAPAQLDEESFVRMRKAYEGNIRTDMVAAGPGGTFSSSESISLDDLPLDDLPLDDLDDAGRDDRDRLPAVPARVRDREYHLVVGTGPDDVRYYFLFATEQVTASLDELRVILAAGWAATVAGAAGVGHLVSRRTLRPVRDAADASTALAAGLLETRLEPSREDEFGAWADAFNRMADALEEKITALAAAAEWERRFTSDVAHELRTPLTGLSATASLLADELDELPEGARRPAELLVREVRRLRDLVLELLELAELDRGADPVNLERLHLRSAVEAVVDHLTGPVPVTVDVDPEVRVWADRSRLRRVLGNLVANAVRHGGGPVAVSARVGVGDTVALEVADRGPGIPEEDLPHVFERFFKTDRARSGGGSGLGLAIADHHARAQGARLQAANRPGGGAVFTVVLSSAGRAPAPAPRPNPVREVS